MRYITVEQFKEQSEEVQKAFINWWEPSLHDLAYSKKYRESAVDKTTLRIIEDEYHLEILKERNIPLFTLQQLWEFIEDRVNCFVTVDYLTDQYWIQTDDWWNEEEKCFYDKDKLQAFWKCACEVARVIKG